jgi:hypothetical protein
MEMLSHGNFCPESDGCYIPNSLVTTASLAPIPAPVSPETVGSPAAIVTINPVIEPPAVYNEPQVVATYLRENTPAGPAVQATNQALISSLSQIKNGKAPVVVSSLFSQVAALSRETSEYRNEAREFRVPPKVEVEKFTPDFTVAKGRRIESVFLTVRTREGDNISIQFGRNANRDGTSVMTFSFGVNGELSEAEQKALAAMMEKLGAMGDEFFRADTTELRGLKEINTEFIAGFNFTLQRFDPATDTYVEHSYEFSVDEVAQTQTLRAKDVKGYSLDITTQLQSLAGTPNLEHNVLQQYLDLIAQAGDESKAPNVSKRFMMDAFNSIFGGFLQPVVETESVVETEPIVETEPAAVDAAQKAIAAFDSGMPDFTANFRSPVYHNPGFYSQVAAMTLTLEQQTRQEQTGENLLIKQDTRYDLSYSKFEAIPNNSLDMLGANYTYVSVHETAETSRMLSMTGDRVNNLWVEQQVNKETERQQFENFKLIEREAYEYGDRRLQEYAELLEKLNLNNQHRGVDELLIASKEKLFLSLNF